MAVPRLPPVGRVTDNGSTDAWPEVGFASDDARFLVCVPTQVVATVCQIATTFAPLETGGLLMGRYGARGAVLTVGVALPPPPDSLHGRYDFVRGTDGLRKDIAQARAEDASLYVAGEWHSHPAHAPTPSRVDHRHMRWFAWRGLYGCPTPTLLIVGGDFGTGAPWSATVYRRWYQPLILERAW